MFSPIVAALEGGAGLRVESCPHIDRVEEVISAPHESASNQEAFTNAFDWMTNRLLRENSVNSAPYLACAERSQGLHTLATLRRILSKSAIRPVSNTETRGPCFIATGSPEVMANVLTVLRSEIEGDVVA